LVEHDHLGAVIQRDGLENSGLPEVGHILRFSNVLRCCTIVVRTEVEIRNDVGRALDDNCEAALLSWRR
jgi:hypothetical protein